MITFTVALLKNNSRIWRMKSPEASRVYEEHPLVVKYTDVKADDGQTAAFLADFTGHTEGKRVVKLLNGHKNVQSSYNLTKEQVIDALRNNECKYTQAAKSLGMNGKTFRGYMNKHKVRLIWGGKSVDAV